MPYYCNAEVIASHAQERCGINGLYAHAICFVFIISNDRDVGRTELRETRVASAMLIFSNVSSNSHLGSKVGSVHVLSCVIGFVWC
jgi:hypothetical protein